MATHEHETGPADPGLSPRVRRHGGAGRRLAGCLLIAAILGGGAMAETYYVDSLQGSDSNPGTDPDEAWKTTIPVNAADLKPGDEVLFRRGRTWRGSIRAIGGKSGSPTVYGAYGTGTKPVILGSVPRNSRTDWNQAEPNIWMTRPPVFREEKVPFGDLSAARWVLFTEGGAAAEATEPATPAAPGTRAIRCDKAGTAPSDIQFYVTGLELRAGMLFDLEFGAWASEPVPLTGIALSKADKPWTPYGSCNGVPDTIGTEPQTLKVRFSVTSTADDGRITFHLGQSLKPGATLYLAPGALREVTCSPKDPTDVDVGNIIFDAGASTGRKCWTRAELRRRGDFVYLPDTWQVALFCESNPATAYESIELALKRHIIDQSGVSFVTYRDLDLRYGAAHGIGGGSTRGVTVRNVDLSFIGGGHQFTREDGHPVRYGNGIEFWGDARDSLVEGCTIREVYDAALTNQANGGNRQENIVYRNNLIINCEYSFEYWNRGAEAVTRNIVFENNTCLKAGYGWGHGQRPDPNGRHLMFYACNAKHENVVVRYNVFAEATESGLRMDSDWRAGLTLDCNVWYDTGGPLHRFLGRNFAATEFTDFKSETGLDAQSVFAPPVFVDAAAEDFRLADDSPGRLLGKERRTPGITN